jgi:hypothetical protein
LVDSQSNHIHSIFLELKKNSVDVHFAKGQLKTLGKHPNQYY